MNPHSKEASGVGSPPAAEQASPLEDGGETPSVGIERGAVATELAPPAPPAAPPTIPLPVQIAVATPSDTAAPAQNSVLLTDDDGDLIEKEWVNKAKQIVERTRDDPYKQSEELTVFKADYMKKRYDKTIKVSQ